MKFIEVMKYLEDKVNVLGSVMGLQTLQELLSRIGNPQDSLKFIHVAGTNGKGSVCTFLTDALIANGYRIGRYLSPVLTDYCEKIQVNNRHISKAFVGREMEKMFEISRQMVEDGYSHPTTFELETALAFLYFVEKKTDYVVLECGMGGAEDATNVIPAPVLTVFTEISLDHMAILGNTIEEITYIKTGIIKAGSVVVSAAQDPNAKMIIQEKCHKENVKYEFVNINKIRKHQSSLKGQSFSYCLHKKVFIPLHGTYQIENAALALLALDMLAAGGLKLSMQRCYTGMASAVWPGRFEVLSKKPIVVLDGAHNEVAVKKLTDSLKEYFAGKRLIYIMGVLKDKDYSKMIEDSCALAEAIITVTPPIRERALSAFALAEEIRQFHPMVTAADSVEEALEMAMLLAGEEAVIVAFGSLSYLGTMKAAYTKQYGKSGR